MQNKVFFSLSSNIYPFKTGGMEIFNYYLIKELMAKGVDVHYSAIVPLNFDGPKYHHTRHLRPEKLFYPLQDFLIILFNRDIKNFVISYSEAHWLVWKLYTIITKISHINVTIVIHHGKSAPTDHYSLYKNFFSSAKHVVAVSSDIKSNYDKAFGIDCKVVYPILPFKKSEENICTIKERYSIPVDCHVISMVGTIKQMKNPDTLIKALGYLGEKYLQEHKLHAVFAGGGAMISELKMLSQKLSVSSFVHFLGRLPQENICEIMKMSDIFLIASDFEGTSISLLEAMYNSVPIIISRAPGLITMLNEETEALAFQTRNEIELADCIVTYMNESTSVNTRANAAHQKYLKYYNYDNVVKEYCKMFGYE